MKIPFVGPAYRAASLNANAQRAINCYLELDNASPRAPVALYGTPGMILRFTLGAGPVRGAIKQGSYAYFVSGNEVYRVSSSYSAALIGTIGTVTGPVGMASNGTEVLIVDGGGGWLATAGALAPITDPDFPSGVTQADCIGGIFVVTGNGTPQFYWCEEPNVGANWNGLDFASAEGAPDDTVGLKASHLELMLFGNESGEIWVLTGQADQPFERSGNTLMEVGVTAANTIAALDNTVFWLGQDAEGAGVVYKANGYTPVRISTHAMEREFQAYTTTSDAICFTYQQEGHSFYVLTFPTEGKTWVYDVATDQWHERAWRNPSTAALTRWRPNCHVFFNNEHLVGDFENGKVYALDLDTYTDAGDEILRLRATQCLDSKDGRRLFYEDMQVDMETGVGISTGQGSNPQLLMRYSNDSGHTWSNIKSKTMGAVGQYGARAKFGPSGAGRNRVWEISTTEPVKFAVIGAFSRFEVGES
jgi:hypothetical protein